MGGGSESLSTEDELSNKISESDGKTNEPTSDSNSIFCSAERIPAHKLILSIGSQVFMVSY